MRRCFTLVELWSHIYFTPTKKERLLIFDLNRKCGKSYRVSGLVQCKHSQITTQDYMLFDMMKS